MKTEATKHQPKLNQNANAFLDDIDLPEHSQQQAPATKLQ